MLKDLQPGDVIWKGDDGFEFIGNTYNQKTNPHMEIVDVKNLQTGIEEKLCLADLPYIDKQVHIEKANMVLMRLAAEAKEKEIKTDSEQEISDVKACRQSIQGIHDKVAAMPKSRANALVLTKLDEASMWAGKRLQELQAENPYPTSRDPSITTIDKTAPEATKLP